MRTCVLLALTTAAGFNPAPPPRAKKVPDLPALAGSWQMTRYQTGAKDSLGTRQMRVTIDKDVWTFHIRENGQAERASSRYVMKVDPSAKPPLFTWSNAASKTRQYVGTYAADKDTLSVVFTSVNHGDEQTRPTDFANPRRQDYLIVLKRQAAAP
jgi:uncharacterized protein (TIGR03067 family)